MCTSVTEHNIHEHLCYCITIFMSTFVTASQYSCAPLLLHHNIHEHLYYSTTIFMSISITAPQYSWAYLLQHHNINEHLCYWTQYSWAPLVLHHNIHEHLCYWTQYSWAPLLLRHEYRCTVRVTTVIHQFMSKSDQLHLFKITSALTPPCHANRVPTLTPVIMNTVIHTTVSHFLKLHALYCM